MKIFKADFRECQKRTFGHWLQVKRSALIYTAALLAAVTRGIALDSWISTFIAPVALALLVWRIVEDRMLQRDLPGYANYATRVRYRLVPGIWYVLRVVADVKYGVQSWREELACSRS